MAIPDSRRQFNLLFEEHWEMLYKAAYSRIPDQVVVEDLVQEIFIDIWHRRNEIHIKSTLKAYLLTAVKYRVFKYLDQNKKMFFEDVYEMELEGHREGALFSLEELYDQLEVALEKLPEKSRLIFKLNKLEGYSTSEIADKLDLAPQTVQNQLSKSLKLVRGELSHLAPVVVFILFQG
ncbi:sigma-70 family RNA polymerase sigma factor [Litoribacter populi]|uniref:sigma-70 family RNA polymerase sigma factor n=1 Tax=Litoribacter populi TaxID=2598460 RepID=UPI00117D8EEF|nr:sigma-70 family RNA polymerase sigma factor [Litoribacter populi]